jgi:4-carboxymuconolactone decarboxylase
LEKIIAQSQPTSARDAVRDIVPDLIGYSEKWLFGEVWERPQLSKRDRSLIVAWTLIALGREKQLAGHLERALNNGLAKAELSEVITHLAFYADWPAAMTAALVAKDVFAKVWPELRFFPRLPPGWWSFVEVADPPGFQGCVLNTATGGHETRRL